MLQLSGPAGKRRLALNEKFVLHTKVGANGYLLLLEYGVSGKVRLLSPTNGTLEEAQVKVKQTLRFPRNTANSYSANKPGTERVKAVLLPSRVEAEALRNAVTEGSGSEAGNLSASFGKEPFYTADLSLEVR